MTREEILSEARTYLGTRWIHQGRTQKQGVDCLGLLLVVGESFGVHLNMPTDYPRRPDGRFLSCFKECFDNGDMSDLKVGDVLVFAEGKHPCHCGIYTVYRGEPGVIHAHAGLRSVIEQTLDSAKPVIGRPILSFRFPKTED